MAFNWQHPLLSELHFEEAVEQYKLMLRLGTESLVKVLSLEQEGEAVMKVLASKLRTTLQDWMADTEVPLARAAISELQDMVKVIRMLCQDEDPDNTALDSVMTACKGSRQSLRSAISSNSYWGSCAEEVPRDLLGAHNLEARGGQSALTNCGHAGLGGG